MSTLTGQEKLTLEQALEMGDGYLLNFSNRSFAEFFMDFFGIDIYDAKYDYATGSKANRMRAVWKLENDYLVGQVLGSILDNWSTFRNYDSPEEPPVEATQIAQRLRESAPPSDLAELVPLGGDSSFEVLARSVRDSIERGVPESGLDRLHTFVVKFFRVLCGKRGIGTPPDKPLHSMVGEYVRNLRNAGELESVMTERILKSSISVLDTFNSVRNNRSLAHDNEMLDPDEALLILSHVTALLRFVQSIEARRDSLTREDAADEIPF